MVEVRHASVAYPTVFRSQRSQATARMAQPVEDGVAFLPLVEHRDLFNRPMVGFRVHGDVPGVLPVGYEPAHPHDDVPVDEAVVGAAEDVPCYWYTLENILLKHCDFFSVSCLP